MPDKQINEEQSTEISAFAPRRGNVETLCFASENGIAPDCFLITGLPNIRYLTGFTGSSGLLLLQPGAATLYTDPRYSTQASSEADCAVKVVEGPLIAAAASALKRRRSRRVGVERNRLTFEQYESLHTALGKTTEIVPFDSLVEQVRMVKSSEEIALIRESVETNSRALRRALRNFHPGMRESELAAEIDYQARRAGASASAFETIVASDDHSALPHARPTNLKIRDKGFLLIDCGCLVRGYASDMTRTMHLGKAPKRVRFLYGSVLEAQLAAAQAVRPGVTCEQVDRAARKVLETSGLGDAFVHSTGHGLGLEIHEQPRIGKKAKMKLRAGMTVTIEPGAYLDGFGGVRIEDTVLVTEHGCEVLTPTPKDLVEW